MTEGEQTDLHDQIMDKLYELSKALNDRVDVAIKKYENDEELEEGEANADDLVDEVSNIAGAVCNSPNRDEIVGLFDRIIELSKGDLPLYEVEDDQ